MTIRTRRIKLTEDEYNLIQQVIIERGTTQSKIGELIGCDSAQISHKLGKRDISLSFKEAQGIYTALGQDERLKFLENYNNVDARIQHWKDLFQSYVSPLQTAYLNISYESKGSVLRDLEGLVAKYSKPKE